MNIQLRESRLRQKISIRKLAHAINVPEATYRDWERGRSIRSEHLVPLAKALGISVVELLGADADETIQEGFERVIALLKRLKDKASRTPET